MSAITNPGNDLYNPKTGMNPDFSNYKLNNFNAFRAMYEIMSNEGDIEKIQEQFQQLILNGKGFVSSAANGKKLTDKVYNFYKKWPEIAKNPTLKVWVSNALGFFSVTPWKDYPTASSIYVTKEDFPIFMDVNDYLDTLFDEKGNIRTPDYDKLKEFSNLSQDWRAAIDTQYSEYLQKKQEQE